ncbi:MSHA biogenesis protein MshD [Aeromonas bestiarum]|uniref:type IV pilus modification PilV family protein n=1 Tax=Aeromonas bestiarum TaxID=105751 RepID=UPI000CD3CCD7|nr:prepilin-type N-terminal cleavage/methylation domain-containing protein [Aeromonas bestiarum]POG23615.1 MSHA biogenesis protein MshD [Aeromonas bestiarum]
MRAPERGFTLIELIVGIVLLAVALTGILGLLINQAPQAVDPVQQVRAAQLAQRLAGEILQKSFDENSDHNGGRYRCGETVVGVTIPACSTRYGLDGEPAPYAFNDVDDFDTSGNWVDANLFTQTAAGISSEEYRNYRVKIAVNAVDFSDGTLKNTCAAPCSVGKRIDLQVRLPDQSVLDFSFYRGNY